MKLWELINNSLIYIYFYACTLTQDLITCWVTSLSLKLLTFSLKLLVNFEIVNFLFEISSFFNRQRWHDFDLEDFLKMDHLISNSLFWSFKLQIYFESLESLLCVRFLNDIVWLLYLVVNSVSLIPKLIFVGNFLMPSLVLISAL